MKKCDQNIKATLELVQRMIDLASREELEPDDIGCGIMYGMMLDAAYQLKKIAEIERENHIRKGWWQERKSPHGSNC